MPVVQVVFPGHASTTAHIPSSLYFKGSYFHHNARVKIFRLPTLLHSSPICFNSKLSYLISFDLTFLSVGGNSSRC